MLRLDKMTDYSVVVLAHLRRSGAASSAVEIAETTGLPHHTAARVLKMLVRAGFASSTRGRSGGYRANGGYVSVLDVLEALEGRVALAACLDNATAGCAAAGTCPSEGGWNDLNEKIRAVLANESVDSLAARKRCASCIC